MSDESYTHRNKTQISRPTDLKTIHPSVYNDNEYTGVHGLRKAMPELHEYNEFELQYDRYVSGDLLAKGGMKSIARVYDIATSRDVAMAYLTDGDYHRQGVRSRFIEEAKITANLEHPNIVPIHDIGVIPGHTPFFTMKMLSGESLAHILTKVKKNKDKYREKYKLSTLLTIYLKVLDAIEFAHARGVVHLDLKPDNIQVGDYGEVVVLDWGLARILNKDTPQERNTVISRIPPPEAQTMDGEIKGTIGYMSPEQAAGRNNEKDERTDIYALGGILYTILSWRRSIDLPGTDSAKFDSALHDITSGFLLPLENRYRAIPHALRAVTLKAMSLKREDRYQTVGELRNEVLNFVEGFATRAERASLARRVQLWTQRHRSVCFLLLLFFIASLAVGGYLWYKVQQETAAWGVERVILPNVGIASINRWVVREGDWDIKSDHIRSTGQFETPARIQYIQPIYGNVAIEFKAMVESREALESGGDLTLILNWGNPSQKENFDCYYFQLGGLSNSVASIQRKNGVQNMIPFKLEPGKIYHVRVEKEGESLRLFCDGRCILTAEDMFYLEGGYLGFYSMGYGKRFWDISIYERGIPELVTPLSVGDDYYRNSRTLSDPKLKNIMLLQARDLYNRIATLYVNTKLGQQAVLRRAHVNMELARIDAVENDIVELEQIYKDESLRFAMIKGEVALRTQKFPAAHDIYSRALAKFPESAADITGILMTRLNDEILFEGFENYREYFARLVAENQKARAFRFRTKGVRSLEFLRSLRFEMLDLTGNHILDISPLSGMNLKHLSISNNPVISLTPLRGMPLVELDCSETAIGTIEPLRDMNLKTLCLHGCSRLLNIDALHTLKSLERLSLPSHLPKSDLLLLRKNLPKLKYIQFDSSNWSVSPDHFFESLINSR